MPRRCRPDARKPKPPCCTFCWAENWGSSRQPTPRERHACLRRSLTLAPAATPAEHSAWRKRDATSRHEHRPRRVAKRSDGAKEWLGLVPSFRPGCCRNCSSTNAQAGGHRQPRDTATRHQLGDPNLPTAMESKTKSTTTGASQAPSQPTATTPPSPVERCRHTKMKCTRLLGTRLRNLNNMFSVLIPSFRPSNEPRAKTPISVQKQLFESGIGSKIPVLIGVLSEIPVFGFAP